MPLKITSKNFREEVLTSDKPVLLDFYADWCMPCKMIAPTIEEISREVADTKICKVNVDEEPELAERYQVMSIPTLIIVKKGEPQQVIVGVRSKRDILRMLAQ